MLPRAVTTLSLILLLVAGAAAPAAAQTGANVLLVSNSLSEASDRIATYYARKRTVPTEQILRLPLTPNEEVTRAVYESQIELPIANWLRGHSAQDRILYIVLTKDIPLRIRGTGGQGGSVASVDSELTLLYRKLVGTPITLEGPTKNPYFAGDVALTTKSAFTHKTYDIYLVTRLDGYTVDDVIGVIDRGSAPVKQGTIVLDGRFELSETVGNKWLNGAATALAKLPGWSDKVTLDTGMPVLERQTNVIGYYSWGSNATNSKTRHPGNTYVPGAVGGEFVSTDARTFKEPPATWQINDTSNIFGGSHQSLIGDLIREGITGVAGHVAEPYLNGTIRPDVLFPAYLSGFNLAEAFYLGMPSLSWQTVVIGDPLCSPFNNRTLTRAELDPDVDAVSELPAFFSERKIASLAVTGAKTDALKWLARSEVLTARNDAAGARLALEEAAHVDPSLVAAQLTLAGLDERDLKWDAAIERYRQVLQKIPNHAIALNNLGYDLAVHKNDPGAGLPFLLRAYAANPDPVIADSLAWTHHLLGDDQAAEPLITMAARRRPNIADIQLHAAFILAARGKRDVAITALDAAIALDAGFAERPDVKELRGRLNADK